MATIIPVASFDCVVFGATGDLTTRKLLPALFYRFMDGQIPETSRIIGASRSEMTTEAFRERARDAIKRFVPAGDIGEDKLAAFLDHLDYVAVDGAGDEGWEDLAAKLAERPDQVRPYYLATSPDLYGSICQNLAKHGLIGEKSRVVLEKPIGKDLKSARAINDAVGTVFPEEQIFRIDHYLGKETVQNLLALRFANTIFERLWTADVIDHVQITVGETVGVEGRAGYYDTSGALRDMVQNHMLQLLCLMAMESPLSLDANSVRDEKLKVLRALKPITPHDVQSVTVRGQYSAGAVGSQPVDGYRTDLGGDVDSRTETFVALKLEVQSWRWAGVPFYLRTGKRLPRKLSEIVVQFRASPFSIFPAESFGREPNRLVIRLQPEEGIKLEVMTKDPGPGGMRLRPTNLDISFEETFKQRYPDAYERLLMDVVRGNATLFMRRDEVEVAWAWADSLLKAWADRPEPPRPYPAGSWGPTAAIALIERDGRTWHEELR
ncbi:MULTISPECIES: glucose-6-phosphate dehydrogenase [unclassified Methylobacterium]|uniref:glucose-6-phosphate dehydrogenase n=1 Tax=unclassified Methylobacterium TaxID=2615210 RepID=UPI0006F39DE6|nr:MULTISPECIES: glucose-6-phosphate dehydrogenase [unclassified Methylobacterium]KQO63305.1 glucose-6-phosphate dehydrogenase [Methylobacterium sp. Leaf88]KQO69271.1 glucose-6-phosphate dehydrogenase [Methylobacterium sp. Leaf89]KQP52416.1 glucose-6-phosphate dehydrogenase [Methylobacterium sp. Leaf111]KQT71431.1 glucose-6-phosphate dehydrogenase [Methylobacterium sp. Leaf465]